MRTRTSPIWQLPAFEFAALISRSRTYTEVLAHFGLTGRGHNNRTLRRRIEEEGVDITHFRANRFTGQTRAHPLVERLQVGTVVTTSTLRRRLIREGLLETRCALCSLGPEWNGRSLTLQLDHINGDRTDNRLENLRLLCPNCHSQTETFAGRKLRPTPKTRPCCLCAKPCSVDAHHCLSCNALLRRKAERPGLEALAAQVRSVGFRATGRLYGVSDNAIRKWLDDGSR